MPAVYFPGFHTLWRESWSSNQPDAMPTVTMPVSEQKSFHQKISAKSLILQPMLSYLEAVSLKNGNGKVADWQVDQEECGVKIFSLRVQAKGWYILFSESAYSILCWLTEYNDLDSV